MFFFLPMEFKLSGEKATIPTANALLIAASVLIYSLRLGWILCPTSFVVGVFTYGFCHASVQHLALNMWALWVFGNPVNRRLGNALYATIYLGTIVLIGLAGRVFWVSDMAGASGGVFAIVTIALVFMPSARLTLGYMTLFPSSLVTALFKLPEHWLYWFVRWGQFSLKAAWALLLLPLMELWLYFWNGWSWANAAHLLGIFCGATIAFTLHAALANRRSVSANEPDYI